MVPAKQVAAAAAAPRYRSSRSTESLQLKKRSTEEKMIFRC